MSAASPRVAAPAPAWQRRPPAVDVDAAAVLTSLPIRSIHPLVGGRENTTQVVRVAGRGRLLLQQLRTRTGARHRIALADRVPPAAARVGVPVPQLVAADPSADPAWFMRRFVDARSATATLRHAGQARRMAQGAGTWAARWRTMTVTGVRPYRLWSDPPRAGRAAARWLERATPDLAGDVVSRLRSDVAAVTEVLADADPVVAHGDYTPANVLVDRHGRPVCVIDVEFVRLGHPLFDPAWFRAALAIWSPVPWHATWDAFWSAYHHECARLGLAVPDDADAVLGHLGRLRLLEILEHTRDRPDAPLWRDRMHRLALTPAPSG